MIDEDAYDEEDGELQESDLDDLAEEAARFQMHMRLNLESWIRNLSAIRELSETNDCPEKELYELAD